MDVNPPSRRRFLGSTAAATGMLLSGCFFGERIPGGHIFVENRMGGVERLALSVTETTNGSERLVHHVFRVPDSHAIEFDDVLASGNSYEIRARQFDVPEAGIARLGIDVDACDEGDPGEKLDVSILVSSNGPDIITYDCDEPYQKNEELTYVSRSEHEVGTVTGTVPSPTPS